MSFRYYLIFLSLCLLSINRASSQSIYYLGQEQGLSNNTIMSIYKDSYGFMWFGTFDGLNRYDGYSFTKYRKKIGDSTSLPDSKVYDIQEFNGDLYAATSRGLGVLDRKTDKFSIVQYSTERNKIHQLLALTETVTCIEVSDMATFIGTSKAGLL